MGEGRRERERDKEERGKITVKLLGSGEKTTARSCSLRVSLNGGEKGASGRTGPPGRGRGGGEREREQQTQPVRSAGAETERESVRERVR